MSPSPHTQHTHTYAHIRLLATAEHTDVVVVAATDVAAGECSTMLRVCMDGDEEEGDEEEEGEEGETKQEADDDEEVRRKRTRKSRAREEGG